MNGIYHARSANTTKPANTKRAISLALATGLLCQQAIAGTQTISAETEYTYQFSMLNETGIRKTSGPFNAVLNITTEQVFENFGPRATFSIDNVRWANWLNTTGNFGTYDYCKATIAGNTVQLTGHITGNGQVVTPGNDGFNVACVYRLTVHNASRMGTFKSRVVSVVRDSGTPLGSPPMWTISPHIVRPGGRNLGAPDWLIIGQRGDYQVDRRGVWGASGPMHYLQSETIARPGASLSLTTPDSIYLSDMKDSREILRVSGTGSADATWYSTAGSSYTELEIKDRNSNATWTYNGNQRISNGSTFDIRLNSRAQNKWGQRGENVTIRVTIP